jgi:hypothetical protein
VSGDGSVRVFKADGKVGERGRLPPSSDPAGLMNDAAFLESVKGHNVCSELILSDRDSPCSGRTSVSDETSKSEVSSGSCDRFTVLSVDVAAEDVHGKGLGWEGGGGMHADNNVSIPADTDADELSVVMHRRVLSACKANVIFVSVLLRIEVTGDRVCFIVDDLDNEFD